MTRFHICMCLLGLREMHNALQLHVLFLFFLLHVFLPALSGISGNSEQKDILQTVKKLIQCTVLEIQFRSWKYTIVIRIHRNLSNFPFLSKRYKGTRQLHKVDVNNPFQTVFKHMHIVYTYSNCMINQLLYCWQMI